MCERGRSLNTLLLIDIDKILDMDKCHARKVLLDHFRSTHFLQKRLDAMILNMEKSKQTVAVAELKNRV